MRKVLLILFLISFFGCSNNEEILTSNATVNINVHQLSLELTGHSLYQARLTDTDAVQGFLQSKHFTLANGLKEGTVTSGSIQRANIVFEEENELITFGQLMAGNGDESYQLNDTEVQSDGLHTSTRFTFYDRKDDIPGMPFNDDGFREYTNAFFLNKNKGWIFCHYTGASSAEYPDGMRTYRINGNSIEIVSVVRDILYNPVDAYFKDENTGWLAVSNWGTAFDYYFLKTTDGGVTWNFVSTGNHNIWIKKMIYLDDMTFILSGEEGLLRTDDGGLTWEATYFDSPDPNHSVSDLVKVRNSNTLYLSISKGLKDHNGLHDIYKSSDKGGTWTKLKRQTFGGRLNFFDDRHGIAHSFGELEYTADGGKNWDLILYSFPSPEED